MMELSMEDPEQVNGGVSMPGAVVGGVTGAIKSAALGAGIGSLFGPVAPWPAGSSEALTDAV